VHLPLLQAMCSTTVSTSNPYVDALPRECHMAGGALLMSLLCSCFKGLTGSQIGVPCGAGNCDRVFHSSIVGGKPLSLLFGSCALLC
jgi:hypothetical protein